MLMAVQFQVFKQDKALGLSAQGTGGTPLHSKLNQHCFASLYNRGRRSISDIIQVITPDVETFRPYSWKHSEARSEAGLEGRLITRVYTSGIHRFVKRVQRHLSQRWYRYRIYVPNMMPPMVNSFFRELYRAAYDLIKTNTSKLIHYKTRQEAEFNINTFKEDQKCH